jgi:hypothetical protein
MGGTRIAMMLPGAVSLGAYEGGALAAVLTAVQAADGDLVVDAISSASAGSVTALVATRALLHGANPVDLMIATWVELPSLAKLKTHNPASPLSMQHLREAATRLLGTSQVPDGTPNAYRQQESIRLSMALTALGGLSYRLVSLREDGSGAPMTTTVSAETFVDWYTTTLASTATTEDLLGAVAGALASASTPIGFPAALLDRSKDSIAIAQYAANGLVNPTNDWHIWYSDGGDIDNEPFGRVLDLIEDTSTASDDDRVIVLLETEPSIPVWGGKWFDPDSSHVPTWTSTLRRVGHIQKLHNYYDDLRRLEKTNSRLKWIETVASHLESSLVEATSKLTAEDRTAVQSAIASALRDASDAIDVDKQQLRAAITARTSSPPAPEASTAPEPPTILEVLEQAAGLHGKRRVVVEIISPDLDPNDHRPASDKLAGEFLFHFGGFFDEQLRQSDFALGYRNASTWLTGWLRGRVHNPDLVLESVTKEYERIGWDTIRRGDASLRTLSPGEDAQAAELVAHLLHVVEYGLRHDIIGKDHSAAPSSQLGS